MLCRGRTCPALSPALQVFNGLLPCGKSMFFAELLHEIDQLVDALRRHGVVDGGAHTADKAMPLQVHKACLCSGGAERLVGVGLVKVTFIMLRYSFCTGLR